MPTAFVLINCDLGSEGDIIKEIKQISEVIDVIHTIGVYDIIVKISSSDMFKLRKIIKLGIKNIDKVRSTLTIIMTEGKAQKK